MRVNYESTDLFGGEPNYSWETKGHLPNHLYNIWRTAMRVYLSHCRTTPIKRFSIENTTVTILSGFNGLYYWLCEGEVNDNQTFEYGKFTVKESLESVLDYLSNSYDFIPSEKLSELLTT